MRVPGTRRRRSGPARLAVAVAMTASLATLPATPSLASSTASTGLSTASSTTSPATPGAGTGTNGGSTGGTTTTPATTADRVELTKYEGIAAPGLPLTMSGQVELADPAGATDLVVQVSAGQAVTSRATMEKIRKDPTLSGTARYATRLGSAVSVTNGRFTVDQDLTWRPTDPVTVFPLKIAVCERSCGSSADELTATYAFLVWTQNASSTTKVAPTAVSTVLPIDDQPRLRSDNRLTDNELAGEIGPDGRLRKLLDAASPVSGQRSTIALAVDPTLLKALKLMEKGDGRDGEEPGYEYASPSGAQRAKLSTDAADFLNDLRAFADAGNTVLALPWGDADLTALLHSGQAHEARIAVETGRTVVAEFLGRDPKTDDVKAAYPVDGLADSVTEAFLADPAIDMSTMIIDDRLLPAARTSTVTPTALTIQQTLTQPIRALAADHVLTDLVAGTSQPTEQSLDQRLAGVLAELAMITSEDSTQSRLAVLALPRRWDPPGDWAAKVLGALATSTSASAPYQPVTEPVSLPTGPVDDADASSSTRSTSAAMAVTVPAGKARGQLTYPDWAAAKEIPKSYVDSVEHLRTEAEELEPVLCAQATPDGEVVNNTGCPNSKLVVEPMANTLRTALSVSWRENRGGAVRLSQEVDGRINLIRNSIEVIASPKVTLTSREGTVPLTVKNLSDLNPDSEFPMTVIVSLSSNDQTRLRSSAQVARRINPGEVAQIEVELTSDSAGTFPVYVQVLTPDGKRLTSQSTVILVRSTAYGTVANAITYAAIGLFAAVIVLRLVRRMRRRGRGGGGDEPPSAVADVTQTGPNAVVTGDRATTPIRRIQANAAGTQRTEVERAYAGGVPANPSEP